MSDVTCAVLIGHDVQLLSWCLTNARERAGMDHEWLVVNWIPADRPEAAVAIRDWCHQAGVRYTSYWGEEQPADPAQRTAWFLRCLYRGWNEVYASADTKWVARLGSDQFFSRDWLAQLFRPVERCGERATFHTWTVESPLAVRSRHEIREFGTTPDTFDTAQFDYYADALRHRYDSRYYLHASECRLYHRHPARGLQLRPDGVTWLQTRALWEEFGPLPDGINAEGVTGDVAYMDRLFDAHVPAYLVPTSVAYHLVAGESRNREGQGR